MNLKIKQVIIKVESQEEFFKEQEKIFRDLDKGILPKKDSLIVLKN